MPTNKRLDKNVILTYFIYTYVHLYYMYSPIYMHTYKFYPATKKAITSFIGKSMILRVTMLNEISQAKKK